MALHANIVEPVIESSMHTLAIEPGSCLEGGVVDEFTTCYVEEIPCLKDFATTLEPRATEPENQDGSGLKGEPIE